MYAVIRTGGKQYRVEPGVELLVEKLGVVKTGEPVEMTDVLLYSDEACLEIGKPTLPASVHCLCLGDERGPKARTYKYRRSGNYARTYGHRQDYTRLRVERIERKA